MPGAWRISSGLESNFMETGELICRAAWDLCSGTPLLPVPGRFGHCD
jgi:hypothetical protein